LSSKFYIAIYLPGCCFLSAGQYLYEEVCSCPELEVAFVWNRSAEKMRGTVAEELILSNLSDAGSR